MLSTGLVGWNNALIEQPVKKYAYFIYKLDAFVYLVCWVGTGMVWNVYLLISLVNFIKCNDTSQIANSFNKQSPVERTSKALHTKFVNMKNKAKLLNLKSYMKDFSRKHSKLVNENIRVSAALWNLHKYPYRIHLGPPNN